MNEAELADAAYIISLVAMDADKIVEFLRENGYKVEAEA